MGPAVRIASLAALLLSGCSAPAVVGSCPVRQGATPEQLDADLRACMARVCDDDLLLLGRDIDVLFLIDNSPGMAEKQAALARSLPRLLQQIDSAGIGYHVGFATSDVGTLVAPGKPWTIPQGACGSFEGDDGTLQRVACSARTGLSAGAVAACAALCPDPAFLPSGGKGYVSKVNGLTNVPRDVQMGVDLGPQRALQCMALVGDAGCGVEGPLEGAKRALDGHNPRNADFLRPNSVLAVIFLTDEDDCSVALSRRAENDPVTSDCPVPDKGAGPSCFNPDYRCLAMDVACNEPMNATGDKTSCHERQDSYLESVDTYVRFFSALRPAEKLLIGGIWTLPRLDGGGKLRVIQQQGMTRSDRLDRATGGAAGCVSAGDPSVYAHPQLRLSKFARQLKGSIELSVCDTEGYPQAMDTLARELLLKLEKPCLGVVPRLANDKPLCLAGDVDERAPCRLISEPFPVCGAACCAAWAAAARPSAGDAGIQAACADEVQAPCYCAVVSAAGACAGGSVTGVVRRGAPPPGQIANIYCAAK